MITKKIRILALLCCGLFVSSMALSYEASLLLRSFDSQINLYSNESDCLYKLKDIRSTVCPCLTRQINPTIMNHISYIHKRFWLFFLSVENSRLSETPYSYDFACLLDRCINWNAYYFYPSFWRAVGTKERDNENVVLSAKAYSLEDDTPKKMALEFDISGATNEAKALGLSKLQELKIAYRERDDNTIEVTLESLGNQHCIELFLPKSFLFRAMNSQFINQQRGGTVTFPLANKLTAIIQSPTNGSIDTNKSISSTPLLPPNVNNASGDCDIVCQTDKDMSLFIASIDSKNNKHTENSQSHIINSHAWIFPENAQFYGFEKKKQQAFDGMRETLLTIRELMYTPITASEPASEQTALKEKILSAGFTIIDVPPDGYCMYSAVEKWFEHEQHPMMQEIKKKYQRSNLGHNLYHYIKDRAIALHQYNPEDPMIAKWAQTMPMTSDKAPLWGVDDMLLNIIAPTIEKPILLLHASVQDRSNLKLAAHLFKKDENGQPQARWNIGDNDVLKILGKSKHDNEYMILLNADNHWQLVFPTERKS